MNPTFEYFMNHATALEVDIERYKFEMLRNFLNGKNIQQITEEYRICNREICTRLLAETAEKLMTASQSNNKRDSFSTDIRYAKHFKDYLLPKIEEKLERD